MVRPPYFVAQRLIAWAADQWAEFDGWCAGQGFDPLTLPVDRLYNLLEYRLLACAGDSRERDKLQAELHAEPPGYAARRAKDPEAAQLDADGFLAAMAAQQALSKTLRT